MHIKCRSGNPDLIPRVSSTQNEIVISGEKLTGFQPIMGYVLIYGLRVKYIVNVIERECQFTTGVLPNRTGAAVPPGTIGTGYLHREAIQFPLAISDRINGFVSGAGYSVDAVSF